MDEQPIPARKFQDLVQRHAARDPAYALRRKGIDTMLAGNVDTGKAVLRDLSPFEIAASIRR